MQPAVERKHSADPARRETGNRHCTGHDAFNTAGRDPLSVA
jgi:hypothetical protein